jgi:hypothetical protein
MASGESKQKSKANAGGGESKQKSKANASGGECLFPL